ncbi:MAG: D-TA family PLP-dependent enzyme [Pseudomonadota bacterium]
MTFDDLDTPCILVDAKRADSNLTKAQTYADKQGLKLRPHIKTHKLPLFAKRQLELGAVGITCQKLGEAEVMAGAGIPDILISYNIVGDAKLARLKKLHDRLTVTVCADHEAHIQGYADAFTDADHPLPVLVECDTGSQRCGVQSPEDALALAQRVAAAPGLRFDGLITYPPRGLVGVNDWFERAKHMLCQAGLPPRTLSNGGSPDLYHAHTVTHATEHRPGTYIYLDRMQVGYGLGTLSDCALTVLATVVSAPTADRFILDAGSKALTSDLCDAPGFGHIIEHPDAVIAVLNEEHGIVDASRCKSRVTIGDKIRIIPNHVCPVSNLFDSVHLIDGDALVETIIVAARGQVT